MILSKSSSLFLERVCSFMLSLCNKGAKACLILRLPQKNFSITRICSDMVGFSRICSDFSSQLSVFRFEVSSFRLIPIPSPPRKSRYTVTSVDTQALTPLQTRYNPPPKPLQRERGAVAPQSGSPESFRGPFGVRINHTSPRWYPGVLDICTLPIVAHPQP